MHSRKDKGDVKLCEHTVQKFGCKECSRIQARQWNTANPQKRRDMSIKHNYLRRLEVIEYLGGKCMHCGFTDIRALQFDHKQGGGTQDRKTCSLPKLMRLILAGKRPDIQLLCANCNSIKRWDNWEFRPATKIPAVV
jgi:hypothetical protein